MLAFVMALGAVVVCIEVANHRHAIDLKTLLFESSFPQCIALAVFFFIIAPFERLKLAPPWFCLLIGFALEAFDPTRSDPVYFFIPGISLLFRYGYFRKQTPWKVFAVVGLLVAGAIVGALLEHHPPALTYVSKELTGAAYLFQYVFLNICLIIVEWVVFSDRVNPAIFPGRQVTPPTFLIAKDYGLTYRQFEIMEKVFTERIHPSAVGDLLETKIAETTVNVHIHNAYQLLGVSNRSDMILLLDGRVIVWDKLEADRRLQEFMDLHHELTTF